MGRGSIRDNLSVSAWIRRLGNAISSESCQPALRYIETNAFQLERSTISGHEAAWRSHGDKQYRGARLIQADYSNGITLAHLVIAQKDDESRVGIGVMNSRSINGRSIQVYEVSGSTLKKGLQLRSFGSGDLRATGANGERITIPASKGAALARSSKCNPCKDICGMLHSLGCGLGGIYACFLICATTGPACPIVCPVVFLVMCIVSNYTNCKWICNDVLEYC